VKSLFRPLYLLYCSGCNKKDQSVPCTWTMCLRVDLDSGQGRVGSSSSDRKSRQSECVDDVVSRYKVEDMWSGGGKGEWGVYGYYSPDSLCSILLGTVLYCGVLYCTMLEYYIGRLDNGEYTFPSLPLCNYYAQTQRPGLHGVTSTW